MPNWWRITRYDPAGRDERGAFLGTAWTSIADVGAVFEGVELTLDEYERVGAAYVDAFAAFANESQIEDVQIRSLESGDGWREGEILPLASARDVVGRMLREEVICRLEAPDNTFALHVGFDLYMFVGSMRACPLAERRARALGLFVEPGWQSRLWPEDDA